MSRKFFRRYMPDHEKIRNHRLLNRLFGKLLHDPNLLHLNRRSVSGAMAVGLFCAFIPLPTQMLVAAAAAIVFRVNLPIAVGLVWLTNPVTIPPMFYFCYKVGTWILGAPLQPVDFSLSWEWMEHELGLIWQPLLLGCFIVGSVAAATGYGLTRLFWRLHVISHLRERRRRRLEREAAKLQVDSEDRLK